MLATGRGDKLVPVSDSERMATVLEVECPETAVQVRSMRVSF